MQDENEIFSTLEQIVLKAANGKQCEVETDYVVSFYKYYFDLEILKFQLKIVKSIIRTVSDNKFETFHDEKRL